MVVSATGEVREVIPKLLINLDRLRLRQHLVTSGGSAEFLVTTLHESTADHIKRSTAALKHSSA